jgi:hypothetical protein
MISQLKALDIAIKCVTDWRRRHYATGEAAYNRGDRGLTFIEDGHKHYTEFSQVIRQLEDLKEILTDAPAVVDELGDLPLFESMVKS